jgi:hypothetical protein
MEEKRINKLAICGRVDKERGLRNNNRKRRKRSENK